MNANHSNYPDVVTLDLKKKEEEEEEGCGGWLRDLLSLTAPVSRLENN